MLQQRRAVHEMGPANADRRLNRGWMATVGEVKPHARAVRGPQRGCGGAVTEDGVELQGELRDRVRAHLEKKGFRTKG